MNWVDGHDQFIGQLIEGKRMDKKTYKVFAQEVVYYMKDVEAESEDEIRKMVFDGELSFDFTDCCDAFDFELTAVEEVKRYD
jgi:hypothetical protein